MRLLISVQSNLGHIVHRLGDTASQRPNMWPISISHSGASDVPFGNSGEIYHTESHVGLSSGEDRMIVSWVIFDTYRCASDGQTNRQMDRFTTASTALCIVNYMKTEVAGAHY